MEVGRKKVKIQPQDAIMSQKRRYLPRASLSCFSKPVASAEEEPDIQMDGDLLCLIPKLYPPHKPP